MFQSCLYIYTEIEETWESKNTDSLSLPCNASKLEHIEVVPTIKAHESQPHLVIIKSCICPGNTGGPGLQVTVQRTRGL